MRLSGHVLPVFSLPTCTYIVHLPQGNVIFGRTSWTGLFALASVLRAEPGTYLAL